MAFPTTVLPVVTELLVNGTWTDFSTRVRDTDLAPGIAITRGRSNELQRVQPSRSLMALNNRDGAMSTRLPSSAYYGLLGRNTQIRHRIRWVSDAFGRTASSSWGSTDTGQAWTNVGGSASDFSVGGSGQGKHTMTSVNVFRTSTVPLPVYATDVTVKVNSSAVATGASITPRAFFGADTSNYYEAQLSLRTDSTVQLTLSKRVAGVGSTLVAAVSVGTYAVGVRWSIRLQKTSYGIVRAKAWKTDSESEPVAWTSSTTTADTSVSTYAIAGVQSRLETGNTNVNPVLSYDDFEVNSYRFWGEVPSWPQQSTTDGNDVWVPIEAAGIMRRLGGSRRALRSALTRAMLGISEGDFQPIAHWSCEDGSGSTSFASSFSGQPAATLTGSVSPASYSGFDGSQPLPILSSGTISAQLPSYTDTGIWQIQFTIMIPSSGFSNDADMVIIQMVPGHAMASIYLTYIQSSGELRLSALNAAGASLSSSDTVGNAWQRDTPYLCAISNLVSGSTNTVIVSLFATNGDSVVSTNIQPDGFFAGTAGMPSRFQAVATSVSSGWSAGQVALYNGDILTTPNIGPNAQAAGGYVGETATDRLTRLCREENIYLDIIGDTTDSAAMGPQPVGKLLDVLADCATADLGVLYEPRDALGLAYRTRPSLYNQTGLTLDYDASQVFPPFAPIEDDQTIVNDATARRPSGSFARVVADTGPLSTAEPPDGVGTYEEDLSYNVAYDTQLEPIASWRVHVGSMDDKPRFPNVHVMLHAPGFTGSAALTGQAAAVDIADYLAIDNPPAWLPPDLIELLAQGSREILRNYAWDITWNCTPAGPYRVFVLDQDRLEGDHALASSVTTSATSWSVKTNSGPLLSTTDTGQQWMCEGELVTVTAVSGGASPQTATVTRNVDGIPGGKAHGADAVVELSPAPYLAL